MLDNYNNTELKELCSFVRDNIQLNKYDECMSMINEAMSKYPDAPHPHNLLGIVLEKKGEHSKAMSHFRAAYALDPSYKPAKCNLETYGTFYSIGKVVYDIDDLPEEEPNNREIIYNEKGVGYIVTKSQIQPCSNFLGRAVRGS